jgi:glycosyltransferase involved in cell wall biosynthesis
MPNQTITIALPAFNEQVALPGVVSACLAELEHINCEKKELLIVNDGSTDRTADVIAEICEQYANVRMYDHARNSGFAAVQKSCYREARTDWIFLLPADGQVPPREIHKFLNKTDQNDLMFGAAQSDPESGLRRVQSGLYHGLVDALFGLRLGDFGACVMVRRALVQSLELKSKTPVLMTELAVRARAAGARVASIPVHKKPREHGAARGGRMLHLTPVIASELAALYIDLKIRGRSKQLPDRGGGR